MRATLDGRRSIPGLHLASLPTAPPDWPIGLRLRLLPRPRQSRLRALDSTQAFDLGRKYGWRARLWAQILPFGIGTVGDPRLCDFGATIESLDFARMPSRDVVPLP